MSQTRVFVQIHPREPREPDWEFDAVQMRQLSCGQSHCAAIGADGTLFTWGEGDSGALGHPPHGRTCVAMALPFQVEALRGKIITKVSCGSSHTAALTSTGELWTWGAGELGHNFFADQVDTPRRVFVYKAKDYPPKQRLATAVSGLISTPPCIPPQLRGGSPVVDVACGYGYTVVKLYNGELQTFGNTSCTHLKVRGYHRDRYSPHDIHPDKLFHWPQVVDHMAMSREITLWPSS
jgi:alpha-tubulin suppressor-like RCC1 family protein